jgi:Tfp pilus assembly protein PilW
VTRLSTGRRDDDSGLGLVELLVAASIASVLLVTVATTLVGGLTTSKQMQARTMATADARLALDVVVRRLRVAVRPPGAAGAFIRAEPYAAGFYASLSPAGTTSDVVPSLVEYAFRASGCLEEAVTPGVATTASNGAVTYSWPSTGRRSRCLVSGDLKAAGTSLFTYYEAVDTATALATPPAAVPAASLDKIRSVGVDVAVRARVGAGARPVPARTRVTLVNRLSEDGFK